jgi:1,4-alpha-glucan branching enzyme
MYRSSYHHNEITFSMVYAFTESFLLPISHDEVARKRDPRCTRCPATSGRSSRTCARVSRIHVVASGQALLFMGPNSGNRRSGAKSVGLTGGFSTSRSTGAPHLVR